MKKKHGRLWSQVAKSWDTTLLGLLGTLATAGPPLLATYQAGVPVEWDKVAMGLVFAVFGALAKSVRVSGA